MDSIAITVVKAYGEISMEALFGTDFRDKSLPV
jgi:hypothetical protein